MILLSGAFPNITPIPEILPSTNCIPRLLRSVSEKNPGQSACGSWPYRYLSAAITSSKMIPLTFDNMETLIKPFEHLVSCFKAQPSSVQLNAVTDDVHKTEPFPKKGFTNTGFEMVEVINGCPGIKIGSRN